MSFRDLKAAARRVIHSHLKVPALYIREGSDPLPIFVRVHSDWRALGEVDGTSFNYAERQAVLPSIIFMRDEVPAPARNAVVTTAVDEMWRVDNVLPIDGISITAQASRVAPANRVGLPYPGNADWPLSLWG